MGGPPHGVDPTAGIWSPAGGWNPDPKYWRRNTAIGFVVAAALCIPVFMTSARLEMHHQYPYRPILSQRWCKNFPPKPEDDIASNPEDLTEKLGEPI